MPRAICEDCGSLVEAELTHNGVGRVCHYVHCGWGHESSPDDLISDDVAKIIADLEAKLVKAVEALKDIVKDCEADYPPSHGAIKYFARATLAEIKGESHE